MPSLKPAAGPATQLVAVSSRALVAALMLTLLASAWLRISSLGTVAHRTPDETHYAAEARTLAQHGPQGVAEIIAAFRANPDLPSPTRIGYLRLLEAWMRATGLSDERAGADLSCAASILSSLLVALIGWRFLSPLSAVAAVTLFAVSPVELMTARRGWEESVVELLSLAALALACEITLRRHTHRTQLALIAAFGCLGAFCLATKEMALAAYAVWAAAAALALWRMRRRREAAMLGAASVAGVGIGALWVGFSLGGLSLLVELPRLTAALLTTSEYSLMYEAGSPLDLAQAVWGLAAVALVLALGGLAVAFIGKKPGDGAWQSRSLLLAGLAGFVLAFVAAVVVVPHHLNLRYLCMVFAPLFLMAGAGLDAGAMRLAGLSPREEAPLMLGTTLFALLILATLNLRQFRQQFEQPDVQDLSLRMVLTAEGEPPPPVMTTAPAEPADAAQWIALSVEDLRENRNQEGIDAARKALALDPRSAAAWNNIAAANENLQRWDEAIDAAQHALQIDPTLQIARSNLNWSLEQKARGAAATR